jgi:hypothetical protein
VPFIRADLYAKIAALADPERFQAAAEPSAAAFTVGPAERGSGSGRLPQSWDDIGVGSLVLAGAPEIETELGWWEAVVVEQNDDMFTLRWRQYPRERRIARHRLNLARLYPAGTSDTAAHSTVQEPAGKPAKPPADKETRPKPEGSTDRYAADWGSIDVGHLVIAKEDGPWQSWWEGIIAKAEGDALTIQWRKHPDLPPIVRHRAHVALLPPKPAANA